MTSLITLSKPVQFHPIHKKKKRKKRKGVHWGDSSSDDDYGSSDNSESDSRGSGASTPDYGEMEKKEEKKEKEGGGDVEDGYETPTESASKSSFFGLGSVFSAAEKFGTSSAKKINQLARGKTQEALAAAPAASETMNRILAAGTAAPPLLVAQMSVASEKKQPPLGKAKASDAKKSPALDLGAASATPEADPFSAQPIATTVDSHDSSSKPTLALRDLDPAEEAAKYKNLGSDEKLGIWPSLRKL